MGQEATCYGKDARQDSTTGVETSEGHISSVREESWSRFHGGEPYGRVMRANEHGAQLPHPGCAPWDAIYWMA